MTNTDPSAFPDQHTDSFQAVNLGEVYGGGELYNIPGQSFDLDERVSLNGHLPVIIKTRVADAHGNPDPHGVEEDWWIQNGVAVNLVRAIKRPDAKLRTFSIQHALEEGFPPRLVIGETMPMLDVGTVSDTRVRSDKDNWRAVTVQSVLAAGGRPARSGQSGVGAMEQYAARFRVAQRKSIEAYTAQAADQLEKARADFRLRTQALGTVAARWSGAVDNAAARKRRP